MLLHKTSFFLLLFAFIVPPFWAYNAWWVLHSRKTQGVMAFAGMGNAGDQVKEDYSVISFTVDGKDIWFNGLGNLPYKTGDSVPVRYLVEDMYDARVDIFAGIWGSALVYSGVPALILLVLFLHRKVVPWGMGVRLTTRKPFIQLSKRPVSKRHDHE